MNTYKIADLLVNMDCVGAIFKSRSKPYQTDNECPIDITININYGSLGKAREKYNYLSLNELEYIKTGFEFSSSILDYNGFCLHSSAIAFDNKAVLFSAPCGTGKSTHTRLWQEYFGHNHAVIINDDKPALRLIDDIFYVYGTPWSGKSDLNTNIKVPLQAIVFIEQSENNHIRHLDSKEAVQMMIYQSLRPSSNNNKMSKLLDLLDVLVRKVDIYKMGCTISTEAVKLAYDEIFNKCLER